jgi:hypothetical protein
VRPAGFLSKKFTPAQCSCHTWEHKLRAILEALIKWEDKLVGRNFTTTMDYKALPFLKAYMFNQQIHWWKFHIFFKDSSFSAHIPLAINCYTFDTLSGLSDADVDLFFCMGRCFVCQMATHRCSGYQSFGSAR